MQLLIYLTAIKPIARLFVKLPKWAPRLDNGRAIQVCGNLPSLCSVYVPPDCERVTVPVSSGSPCDTCTQSSRVYDLGTPRESFRSSK